MGAWLNYYIKSIRRLGRGPEFSADLGEKSGMTGSCERDACGGARPRRNTVRLFTAHRPNRQQPTSIRQGISSTDKDVIPGIPKVRMAGGLSSLLRNEGFGGVGRVEIIRLPMCAVALVDGRYRQGLDSGPVSVKLPLGVQGACAVPVVGLAHVRTSSGTRDSLPSGQLGDNGRTAVFRLKEVLPPVRRQPVRMEGVDPVATRYRSQSGNKAGIPCFMRTSGAESA